MSDIKIYCPTIREHFFHEMHSRIKHYDCCLIDGHNAKSLSYLFNNIIATSDNDIIIIANDKARPIDDDVDKIIKLLTSGYGFVALYRLGFFGFHKALIKKIGFFDERFSTAGYEDNDIFLRLRYNNIASYITEEIDYVKDINTLWNHKNSRQFFYKKYTFDNKNKTITKNIAEEIYDYSIFSGENENKTWEYSYLPKEAFWAYKDFYNQMISFTLLESIKP